MPYISSKTEFEAFFKELLELDLPQKTKTYYTEKYNERENWSMAYKKTLPCLKINTTSRIEGINSIIKKEISSSTTLLELFCRLLSIADHALNVNYPDDQDIHSLLLENLENVNILKSLKPNLSSYSYAQVALNLNSSYNYEVRLYAGIYKIKNKYSEEEFQIKKGELVRCKCKYYATMGLPCPHLIALALKYKDINLLETIRSRWNANNNSKEFEETSLIEFTRQFLLKMSDEGKMDFYFI